MPEALKIFHKDFEARYVKLRGGDSKEVSQTKAMLAKATEKAKCNVCHEGKDKKKRNAYADQLAKLLDKKNTKKVIKVLDQVAKIKTDPKDKKSPTFADLISQGKLSAPPPKTKTILIRN